MTRYGTILRTTLVAGVAAAALAGCGMMGMNSNVASFSGAMNAASEVPPNMTRGTGMAEAWLDKSNNRLKYKITYTGLSGPATAAHFHGPATAGANAGVVLPFPDAASPIEGQATLTAAQAADLMAGRWYANVHTAANPAGEIRGQMLPKM
ncbi:MAG: hypothetical protein JWQ03_72 [Variovorax sp.]|nr:hypothetical protein [Variovorax sp.]